MSGIPCKTCDKGTLELKTVHKMSGIVVIIGYILLIPSFFGILMGGCTMFGAGAATTKTGTDIIANVKQTLTQANIPQDVSAAVLASRPVTPDQESRLTAEQRSAVHRASSQLTGGLAGAGIGGAMMGGFALFMIVGSLVGGLLGWLLISKKTILQCRMCSAVTAAS